MYLKHYRSVFSEAKGHLLALKYIYVSISSTVSILSDTSFLLTFKKLALTIP